MIQTILVLALLIMVGYLNLLQAKKICRNKYCSKCVISKQQKLAQIILTISAFLVILSAGFLSHSLLFK